MPIYEYRAVAGTRGCAHCRAGFECIESITGPPTNACPKCGSPVERIISAPAIGASQSGLDERAKNAGFTKLKRLGKGEYEKEY